MRLAARQLGCLLLLALAACSDGGPKLGPPASVTKSGDGQTGKAGRPLSEPLVVNVADAQGALLPGVAVTFSVGAGGGTVSAPNVQTDASGRAATTWTLGREAGAEQRVVASVAKPDGTTLTTSFSANAQAGDPATLTRAFGDGQQGGTGVTLRDSLMVRVTDEFGNAVSGVTVSWSVQGGGTVSPATSTTNAAGLAATSWRLGDMLGAGTVIATVGALPAQTFTATATITITSIVPALLTPGATVTVTGIGFTPGATANALLVAGAQVPIQEATATTVTAVLPAVLPCVPPGDVTVALVSGTVRAERRHPARTTTERAIAVGQILIGTPGDPLTCIQLPQAGGRYLIAVTNTSSAPPIATSLRLRATAATGAVATTSVEAPPPGRAAADRTGALERRSGHRALLESGTMEFERLRARGAFAAAPRAGIAAQQAVPNVGDTLAMRVPRISQSGTINCTAFEDIRARVAYVGARSIVLDDVANPLSGAIDSLYRRLGAEFDASQYDVVRHNFGDPLLLDPQLDDNGRLVMLFSNHVNSSTNAAAFISPLDFFPRSQCLTSNAMEVFYGYVPTVNSQTFAAGSIKAWFWDIRGAVVHEVKHIASFAQRIQADAPAEETWLEEGTAMIAEELWARTVFGYEKGANTGYAPSVGCEIDGALNHRPVDCDDRPGIMFIHFAFLADWMEAPSTQSMLCALPEVTCTGQSIYGTGWLFLRWLLDHAGQPEEVLLRALHNASVRGTQNIQAQFGRPYADLLPEWALAVALDDRAGFTSSRAFTAITSWHIRDIYAGLEQELTAFPSVFPLLVRPFGYGNAELSVGVLRGGSAAFFELTGTPAGTQVLEFTTAPGQPLGSETRVSIVRIE